MSSPPSHKSSFQSIVGRAMSVLSCSHQLPRSDSATSHFSQESQEEVTKSSAEVPNDSRSHPTARQPRRLLFGRILSSSTNHNASDKKTTMPSPTFEADGSTAVPSGGTSESVCLPTLHPHHHQHHSPAVTTGPLLQCLSAAEKEAQVIVLRSRRQGELRLRKVSPEAEKEVDVFREQHRNMLREGEEELIAEHKRLEECRLEEEDLAALQNVTGTAERKSTVNFLINETLSIEFYLPPTTIRTLSVIGARQRERAERAKT
eukprot:GHVS01062134.1.p1 GENE.GHVS01062134.1~~GHVS01062134.1.p1  ORF type:complete len:261 (+),score=53.92 GHVS01062134.1:55-837(+)